METRELQSELKIDSLSVDSKHLFEQLCTEKRLLKGWREVRKNRGTSGSDGQTMLSNLVLDELDKELEKRELEYCRFADDCNIFVKTPKAAERVMKSINEFIEKKLKLVVNTTKSFVGESALVKFLGMTIVDGTRAIAKQSLRRAMQKVKELTPRGTHEKLEDSIKRINEWSRGWSEYYKMTQYPSQLRTVKGHIRRSQLRTVKGHIRRRLRARIVSQQKSQRNLFNKLIKRGVSRYSAARASFSNKRCWVLSHTSAVDRAYPNRWFI